MPLLSRPRRSLIARSLAAMVTALLGPAVARADYAYILTKTLCDNQADAMDFMWTRDTMPGKPVPFYFDGASFSAVGHTQSLDAFDTVVVSAHGAPGAIGGTSSTGFAGAFQGQHNSVPATVSFLVCSSASSGSGNPSALGALAAKYLDPTTGLTRIGTLTGAKSSCALRRPTSVDITQLKEAIYVDGPDATPGKPIIASLLKQWDTLTHSLPDHSTGTSEAFCLNMISKKAYADFVPFIENTYDTFHVEYIQLINSSDTGSPRTSCGAATGTPVCP
ncbi:hypothetical protein GCM10007301_00820 [Azorhizobium oxalatiphilum]|uniref:Uncharacterized protein n=1 Tax=Azorhizobium oxalatiphilum TaxID=980631 RepID=A0A917BJ84_9HYPH|nr:hypothetical protein [Azorhizobium oxalatiphilum]GGF45146.1 hypothetical protein GCM10007301_00820 [Azorhizobium oxalatiphilum]